ncbi:MAG: 5-formyltetrahydrofolate cyclo-ligase [Rhodospirillaceae bacterium]|nr:5-formyltetrahydrofolate cyclo-ligase [Rhodospirillaceae bacterium]
MNANPEKTAMRQAAKARRAEAALGLGEEGVKSFLETFAKNWGDVFGTDSVVAGYWPMAGEMDVRPALVLLDRVGCLTALPEVVEKDRPLRFRAWVPGEELTKGAHGTAHPLVTAPPMRPDVVLVPLLSFDRAGYRLGWGGGYYDRTLEALRKSGNVVAVGAAYSAQEVDQVPHDGFDQVLDWIITEKEAIKIK